MSAFDQEAPLLILLDASNLICRSYFAMKSMGRNFTAPDGTPTGGISTYLKTVEAVKKKFPEGVLCAIHEHPEGSFRDEISAEYKAHRPPMDAELKSQLKLGQDLLPLLGTPALNSKGFEADDLLCAYAVAAKNAGWNVILVTNDKDMGQVVCDQIKILNPADKDMRLTGSAEILEKMGVGPGLVVEFLALMGDAVDGFKGVEGVGKVTAAKLLNQYGSIQGILDNLGSLSQTQRAKFEAAKEALPQCLELARARLDCPMPLTLEEIRSFKPDWQAALPELERLSFKSWIARAKRELEKPAPKAAPLPAPAASPAESKGQLKLPGI